MSYKTKEDYEVEQIESEAFMKYIQYLRAKIDEVDNNLVETRLRKILFNKLEERINASKR